MYACLHYITGLIVLNSIYSYRLDYLQTLSVFIRPLMIYQRGEITRWESQTPDVTVLIYFLQLMMIQNKATQRTTKQKYRLFETIILEYRPIRMAIHMNSNCRITCTSMTYM